MGVVETDEMWPEVNKEGSNTGAEDKKVELNFQNFANEESAILDLLIEEIPR